MHAMMMPKVMFAMRSGERVMVGAGDAKDFRFKLSGWWRAGVHEVFVEVTSTMVVKAVSPDGPDGLGRSV
jgi:hypothetical protein